MGKFILKLCFWPFLLPIWIFKACLSLLGCFLIGGAIDQAVFGRH